MSTTFRSAIKAALARIQDGLSSEDVAGRKSVAATLRDSIEADPAPPDITVGGRALSRRAVELLESDAALDVPTVKRLLSAAKPPGEDPLEEKAPSAKATPAAPPPTPAKAEPAKAEPVAEPAKAEPVKAEPAKAEPVAEAAESAPPKVEAAASAPAAAEPVIDAPAPGPRPLPRFTLAETDVESVREFVTEATDYLVGAEAALLTLEDNPEDVEAISAVFRAFHTIKGVASFMTLQPIADVAHHAETLLGRIRSGELRCVGANAELAFESLDLLRSMFALLADASEGAELPLPPAYGAVMDRLCDPALGAGESHDAPAPAPEKKAAAAKADVDAFDAAMQAAAEAKVAPKKSAPPPASKADEPKAASPSPPIAAPAAVAAPTVAAPVAAAPAASSAPAPTKAAPPREDKAAPREDKAAPRAAETADAKAKRQDAEATIRVRTDRLDRLIDMVGELVIAQAMLWEDELLRGGGSLLLQNKVSQATKIVRELHDSTLSLRMVPLRATFQKVARVARDVSHRVGKPVQVVVEGDDTEIDRNTVELLADPLIHMVRNAIDHGIEDSEARSKSGKAMAQLAVRAYRAGSDVVIEVEDDGKGIDPAVIFRKAVEKGLISAEANLPESSILLLIFEAGFSTREQVTEISGRGVGMDVVKRAVEALKGTISITSVVGKGTRFTIRLPLTLAMTDGLLVRVGGHRYVIPLANISESIRPTPDVLCTVAEKGEFVSARGELVPIIRLANLFGLEGRAIEDGLLVILTAGATRFAVLVDELLGQQQVVAKSLGPLGAAPAIAGGAILGDGRVGLILDPAGLLVERNMGAVLF